ncbi:MAG TPA: aminodeoxychorismate synthase component I [Paracoccaceae bacterium]|nr:aminodeoxychorismate synthase component I [Paracoccaceae bacterium]HMO71915.1 aminodeoxychorismate synthase component I [Paracoccaceae bacterium]
MTVILENGPDGQAVQFVTPREVVAAWAPEDVVPVLARLDAARAAGMWVAGVIGYEAGLALEPRLLAHAPWRQQGPLLAFGVYDGPEAPGDLPGAEGLRLTRAEPRVTRAVYGAAFDRVAGYIAAGDCYQVNLTFPMDARLSGGDALHLYARLQARGAVRHGGIVDLGPGPAVVSRSPELFFTVDAAGAIRARPMKGTAPRDPDPGRDRALAVELFESIKARAENLMIVDLLRNDIGRISQVGSIRVPELYAVETFTTVHQMSSTVTGRLSGAPGMAGLMAALFPCGSVTGAPKIRAMEIIREVEPDPRGAYCGAMGWMAPDGRAAFAVTIRTLSVFPDGAVVLNVGGGVVADSTAQGEWEEALWKARFAAPI